MTAVIDTPIEKNQRHIAYISIGSNLGDPKAHCRFAMEALDQGGETELISASSLYETSPWGNEEQDPFVNAAVGIATHLEPKVLVRHLRTIEAQRHRERLDRWGPRTLDLDLLLYDDAVVAVPGLTIPHPQMHERLFVLIPLEEIAPDLIHPIIGRSVHDLRIGCSDQGSVERIEAE